MRALNRMPMETSAMTMPYVSVVVPTFNRHEQLAACVQGIIRQDYPRDRFEVIIVDDGSVIPVTAPSHDSQIDVSIQVLRQSNSGPAAARNVGAHHARGDILAFTDDDCIPDPQWLRALMQTFRGGSEKLVGGRTVNALGENLYSAASQMIVDEAYAYFLARSSDLRFFASNNMAVSTKLFHEIGGFDPSFRTAEDRDFCDRWIRRGYLLEYASKATVRHYHRLTLTTFWRQHFHYGRGAYRFHRVRAQRSQSRVRPDVGFYLSVGRRMLVGFGTWKSLRMAGLMGIWQMANVTGYLSKSLWPDRQLSRGMTASRHSDPSVGRPS